MIPCYSHDDEIEDKECMVNIHKELVYEQGISFKYGAGITSVLITYGGHSIHGFWRFHEALRFAEGISTSELITIGRRDGKVILANKFG